MKVSTEDFYTTYNEHGHKRNQFKYFQEIQPGDKIIGYSTSPKAYIDSICELTKVEKEDDEVKRIFFKKIEHFKIPLTLSKIRTNASLLKSEPIKLFRGSLYKLTEEEYNTIIGMLQEINDDEPPRPECYEYTKQQALSELFIEENEFDNIISILRHKKNIILQGSPGVGKTFIAKRLAYTLMEEKNEERVQMIQFHQSYSYEDFIQGYRPTEDGGFNLKNGIFYDFCQLAKEDTDNEYFFIIDEINRGNLSKIFGELMMLIEHDKRGDEFAIPLTYSDSESEKFFIPENLYLIGTMNTADRSLAIVDYALRRRFSFITLKPVFGTSKFKDYLKECSLPDELIKSINDKMKELNDIISNDTKNLGIGYTIGHSYFCLSQNNGLNHKEWYEYVVKNEIKPLLEEYWFDSLDKVKEEIKKLLS
jgi:5-methylcytosine-specific restriction protein B